MPSAYTFADSLRNHDEAFVRWLKGFHVNYGTLGGILSKAYDNVPIIVVFAPVHTAYAKVKDTLDRNGWFDPALTTQSKNALKMEQAQILPFISWERQPIPEAASELRQNAMILRGPEGDIDTRTGNRAIYPFPGAYSTNYTVRFWGGRRYTANYFASWVMGEFGPIGCRDNERLIDVIHPYPYGTVPQSLLFTGSSDETDLEGDDIPYTRTSVTFTLRTWVLKNKVTTYGGRAII